MKYSHVTELQKKVIINKLFKDIVHFLQMSMNKKNCNLKRTCFQQIKLASSSIQYRDGLQRKSVSHPAIRASCSQHVLASPQVISTSPKTFCNLNFPKKQHLPIRQVRKKIHQPDSKIHQPGAIGHDFLCTLQYCCIFTGTGNKCFEVFFFFFFLFHAVGNQLSKI